MITVSELFERNALEETKKTIIIPFSLEGSVCSRRERMFLMS